MVNAVGEITPVVNRVKRAHGQLGGVLRMLDEGREADSVIHQLKAVARALDRAGFAIAVAEMKRYAVDGRVSDDELAELETVFLGLS